MAVNFKIPASPAIQIYENNTFLGADFTTDAGNIDDTKSPNMVNMIRSVPGKVRKRMGYKQVCDLNGQAIYGVHYYSYANIWIIHAGNKIYQFRGGGEQYWVNEDNDKVVTQDDFYIFLQKKQIETVDDMVLLYTGAAENRSTSYELNQLLCILDGKKMLYVRWDKSTEQLVCGKMEDYPDKKVPLVRFACLPDGTGQDYEDFNLLSPRFEQDFIIDSDHSTTTTLQLYTNKIASDPVSMKVLQANGGWIDYEENVNFVVNRNTGVITFANQVSPEDISEVTNVTITGVDNAPYVHVSRVQHGPTFVRLTLSWLISDLINVRFNVTIVTTAGHTFTKSFAWYNIHSSNLGDNKTYIGDADFTAETRPSQSYSPGVTPVAGQDNIKVFASYIPTAGNSDLINHCRFGVLFGINGASDRLFVSGNLNEGDTKDETGNITGTYALKNRSWYSGQYDPTYFPDTGYSQLGSDASAIMGMCVVNSYLASFKDGNELSQDVFIQEGDMITVDDGMGHETSKPAFKLINTLQGAGAISNWCFSYVEVEPVFLSKEGIFSLTSQDITGEKYAQNRSYYLDGKLLNERNMETAIAATWNSYYILCVNNHFYILDGLQPIQTDKSKPYATRQYASFYFEFELDPGETITYIWDMYGQFCFGTSTGRVMRFYNDENALESYNDNGKAYKGLLETADISGKLFYKNKTFRYIALKLTPSRSSSIVIEGRKNGMWDKLKEEYAKLKYFSFIDLTFARTVSDKPQFSFLCDKTQKVVSTKTRIKKVDKVQFRFSNEELNEPMGINNFALEYTQGGNIK